MVKKHPDPANIVCLGKTALGLGTLAAGKCAPLKGIVDGTAQPKIHDHQFPALSDPKVLRAEIPMEQVALVGIVDAGTNLADPPSQLFAFKEPLAPQQLREGFSPGSSHGQGNAPSPLNQPVQSHIRRTSRAALPGRTAQAVHPAPVLAQFALDLLDRQRIGGDTLGKKMELQIGLEIGMGGDPHLAWAGAGQGLLEAIAAGKLLAGDKPGGRLSDQEGLFVQDERWLGRIVRTHVIKQPEPYSVGKPWQVLS